MSENSSNVDWRKVIIGGVILVALIAIVSCVTGDSLSDSAGRVTSAITDGEIDVSAGEGQEEVVSQSGLPVILYADLPPEAHDTIALIESDGPFPYDRDGIVFENREGILPDEEYGYYHEYTVITPGENDRGARRIVTGENGEFYYTDDHYDSFSEVAF